MTNNDLEYQGLARVTTPWRDRGSITYFPMIPLPH
jgi:hypothetical protein